MFVKEFLIEASNQKCYSRYLKSFEEIFLFKDKDKPTDKDLIKFSKTLDAVVERHRDVVQNMAMGILQVEETYGIDAKTGQNIQYFLDRFLMSRISIRMLINQHLLMFGGVEKSEKKNTQIGSIDPNCDVVSILEDAFDSAKFLCEQYYLCSPGFEIEAINSIEKENDHIKLVYVPGHLYHIAFELYKVKNKVLSSEICTSLNYKLIY